MHRNRRAFVAMLTIALLASCNSAQKSQIPATTGLPQATAFHDDPRRIHKLSTIGNVIVNGGFESGLPPWSLVGSGRGSAKIVTTKAHSGTHSAFMGTTSGPAVNGLHGLEQAVTIPTGGVLTFWYQGSSDDTSQYADQEAAITDSQGKIVKQCYKNLETTKTWQEATCDVSALAGENLNVVFGVDDNGYSSTYVNWYIDDVSLLGGGPSPTPSPTANPTTTPSAHPTTTPSASPSPTPTSSGSPIQHVVIVLQENRSFENIFHGYPGAHTVDYGYNHLGQEVPLTATHLMVPYDPTHTYSAWVTEFNNGGMNGFDLETLDYGSGAPNDFAYQYAYQSDVQPYWDMAAEGSLADEFFVDHRSESFAGHQFPIAGASGPITPSLPDYYAAEDPSGGEVCDSQGTGPAINLQTGNEDKTYTTCFDYETIADLLTAANKTWRFYIDASSKDSSYVSSFAVIKHIRDNPEQWKNVVSPATAVYTDAKNGTLANVSWVIGSFANSDHAGQDVPSKNGPSWVTSVMNAVGESKSWDSTAIVLTYDDWGGWFDEQAPFTTFNAFEPGFRIPFVVVSPYSNRGYISHVTHYMGSLLHYIESNFGLGSLGTSDSHSDDLSDMFDYQQEPLQYVPIGSPLGRRFFLHQKNADKVPHGLDRD